MLVFHWKSKKLDTMIKKTKPQKCFMSYENIEKIKS